MDGDDDGYSGPRGDRGGSSDGPPLIAMGPIYMMWESALEKLKVMNYESRYCERGLTPPSKREKPTFNQVHFVYPGRNIDSQLKEFFDLCSWLCTEITGNADHFRVHSEDDPNTNANKLLLALRSLDFRLSFPSSKLRTPHGEAVCSVLEFLTDKAIAQRGFEFSNIIHSESNENEQNEDMDDDDKDRDDIEDEAIGVVEEDVLFEEVAQLEASEASLDNSAHNILHAQIDPIEWKTELERVGPKLVKLSQQTFSNEWRSHVDQTTGSKNQIEKVLSETQGDLLSMNRNVGEEINRIKTKEKYMNHQFAALSSEHQEVKKRLEELQSKSSKTNETVAKLTNDLAEFTEKLDDLKESFDSKDSGIHDTSPLVRIKASLQSIKTEISEFELRIGVVSHTLLAAKNALMKRKQKANLAKARRKGGKKENDDNSIVSGDD